MKKQILFIACFLNALIPALGASQTMSPNDQPDTNAPRNPHGFFIPQAELNPRYEKLPPILPRVASPSAADKITPQNLPRHNPVKRASRYIAVDGKFIPVFDKQESTSSSSILPQSVSDDFTTNDQAVITTDFSPDQLPETTVETGVQSTSKTEMKQIISEPSHPELKKETIIQKEVTLPPQTPDQTEKKQNLPSYRYRYNQYLQDLQAFQHSGQFPYNDDLQQTLGKLRSNQHIFVYQSNPEPD